MNSIPTTNGIIYNTHEDAINALPKTNAGDILRESARVQREKARESFERCDTDGFLSQWASGINAQLDDAKADLMDHGGQTVVRVLVDLETGKVVAVKPISTKFGESFRFNRNGETVWVSAYYAKDSTYAKKGVRIAYMHCHATASTYGRGKGLAGCASVSVREIPYLDWLEKQLAL